VTVPGLGKHAEYGAAREDAGRLSYAPGWIGGCGSTTASLDGHAVREPPFGTPRTMAVWLIADIQNRLFWRVDTSQASK
jgi:hypothetical protein